MTDMTNALPLVKLSVLQPFVSEMRRRDIDPEPIFESVGLTEASTLDPTLSVHVMVVTQFVENAATMAEDRFLGARVGGRLDLRGWSNLEDAEAQAKTVGDYLSIFISRANEVASSATEYLNVAGKTAEFGETRAFAPAILPAQNDAFMASLGLAVLRRALCERIDPSEVTVVVSDPGALPPEFDLMHPIRGDRMGFSLRFPSSWLSVSFESVDMETDAGGTMDPDVGEFVHSLRQIVRSHIGQGSLTASGCARLAGMSHQKLKRRLASLGTDITSEIDYVRQEYARRALAETDKPIADIASELGFTDPANFARAFRRKNKQTPSAFRKSSGDMPLRGPGTDSK